MNNSIYKYLGEARIKEQPKSQLSLLIKNGTIKPQHLSEELVLIFDKMIETINDLQLQITSLQAGGVALKQNLGDSKVLGISQDAVTKNIDEVWKKLENITGEPLRGFTIEATPTYFLGDSSSDIHIKASVIDNESVFNSIAVYFNDTLVVEHIGGNSFEYDLTVDSAGTLKCVADIRGVEYTREQVISNYYNFWIGSGNVYADILQESNLISPKDAVSGQYSIVVKNEQKIIIIIDTSFENGLLKATTNGFEIPLERTTETISGVVCAIYTSYNTYQSGTYNINLSGYNTRK